MTTATQFLDACRADIGYTENPPGSNKTKFAVEAGHANGAAWCQTFLVAHAKTLGLAVPAGADTAYTPSGVNAWKKAGAWHTSDPQPGDWVYFQFDKDPQSDHVGVVESVSTKTITTIEGNTSSTDHGSQSNGGCVARRVRKRTLVLGYGRPVYSQPSAVVARPTIQTGSKGQAVKDWQKFVGVQIDGDFGAATATATKVFQRKAKVAADGVVGPKTWQAAGL